MRRGLAWPALSVCGLVGASLTPPPAIAQEPRAADLRCPLAASYDGNNAFARIIRGELPVSLIAEDDRVIALVPLGWDHPGHALVIPKRAARTLNDLRDDELIAIMHMVKRVAVAQQRALGSTGFSVQQNNGRNQDVCHAHFHVVPNTPAAATPRATRAEMDAMAKRLRAALPAE